MFWRICVKMLMILFAVFTTASAQPNTIGDVVTCEPVQLNKTVEHFITKYNMTTGLFITSIVHLSKLTFPNSSIGSLDLIMDSLARSYRVYIDIKRTNRFELFRRAKLTTVFFHFYYGDTMTCHTFHPVTGEYKAEKIGFHTLKYFCAIPPGYFYTLDFEKHRKEEFALVGVVIVRNKQSEGDIEMFYQEEMIRRFPQHEEIIANYYAQIDS